MSPHPSSRAKKIRVLLLEDSAADAELIVGQLHAQGFSVAPVQVDNRDAFLARLAPPPDLILADYSLPQFSALAALRLLREHGCEVPVIVISGSIGDELAAQCIKEGATDYLLKDRLGRLGVAVESALQAQALHREQQEMKAALRASHEHLQHILQHSPAVIYVRRIEAGTHETELISDNIASFLGCTVAEATVPDWWSSRLHPDDRIEVLDALGVLPQRGEERIEYRIRHKDGSYRWVEDRLRLVRGAQGEPKEIIGVWTDLTERRQAQEAVAAAQRLGRKAQIWRDLLLFSGLAAVVFLASVQFNLFSPALAWILEHDTTFVGEIAGTLVILCVITLIYSSRLLRLARSEVTVRRQAEAALKMLHNELEQRVGKRTAELSAANEGLRREIVERERAEAARRESEERFSKIFRASPAGIGYGTIDEGRLIDVNDQYAGFFGYAREEMIGRTVRELHLWTDFAARDALMQRLHREGSVRAVECRFRRKSGEERVALVSIEKLALGDQAFGIFMLTDVTEHKKLESELLRVQRMESVGRLASGIAHDLNNILAPILMAAPLLRMPLPPADVEKTLSTVELSARRGADLVKQLLMFGRGMEGKRGPIAPGQLIREIVKIVMETFPKNITIDFQVPRDLWSVNGDPTQLHQVLLNLAVNARDAMPRGGTLEFAAANVELDATVAVRHADARPGPHVRITVVDTGEGIPPEIEEKVFDPFFTTKAVGKGTGLGLSTVLTVVKGHGGFLELKSEVGRGTRFDIFLPALPAEKVQADASPPEELPRGQNELVLVVDDEENIRALLREMLVHYGYRVTTAEDGAQAVAVFTQRAAEVALVLSDVDMPLIDGVTLTKVVRRVKPAVKVILSSGLTDANQLNGRAAEIESLNVDAVLSKPFGAERILRAVHTALRK